MASLRFAAALLAVTLLHFAGGRLFEDFARAVDLFLVLVVFYALGSGLVAATVVGVVAGLVTDAVTGGLYGLHGFADTIIGYGTAYAAQRLVVRRPPGVFLIFSLAAALQQAILVGLVVLLQTGPALPELYWMLLKVGTTGVAGVALVLARGWVLRRAEGWRRRRASKLK